MKSKILCSIILVSCLLTGCTENSRTNKFGGDMKIDLSPGEVLENITWKSVGGSTIDNDEYMNDDIPEEINGVELGVKFATWLARDPATHSKLQKKDLNNLS
jgi:hypothetical protein